MSMVQRSRLSDGVRSGTTGPLSRYAMGGVLGLLAMWVSVGVTLDLTASDSPSSALWPWGTQVRLADAARLAVVGAPRSDLDRATAKASAALAREPASAAAARLLGQARGLRGEQAGAEQAYRLAERLSRRDLPTQLFWIERQVATGDVGAVLLHYDRALRTNETSWPALLGTLATASAEPAVATGVAHLLDRAPAWRLDYVTYLTAVTPLPPTFAALIAHVRLDVRDAKQRDLLLAALAKLIEEGRPGEAVRLLPAAYRGSTPIADGDFETPERADLPPFGWMLQDDRDLSATREASSAGHGATVLRLHASAERGGEVASQIIVLEPGRYRLNVLVGDTTDSPLAAPSAIIACSGVTASRLLSLSLIADGNRARRLEADFVVPNGCRGQRLSLAAPPAIGTNAWVDALSITREDGGTAH